MGLPLYRAPVQSDIKHKAAKDPPTRARSTIRRSRLSHYAARQRERLPPSDAPWSPWDQVGSEDGHAPVQVAITAMRTPVAPPPPRRSAFTYEPAAYATRPPDTGVGAASNNSRSGTAPRHPDSSLREVITRGGMSQEMARHFGEQMARLHAATSSSSRPSLTGDGNQRDGIHVQRDNDDYDDDDMTDFFPGADGEPEFSSYIVPSDSRRTPPLRHFPRFSATSTSQQLNTSTTTSSTATTTTNDTRGQRSNAPPARLSSGDVMLRQGPSGQVIALRRVRVAAHPSLAAGGLGDRDRSLSPEDDGVWDTLLSSITPDPQPPSVGTSSFASSASGSGSVNRDSVSTTLTSSSSLGRGGRVRTTMRPLTELERDLDDTYGSNMIADDIVVEEHPCEDNNSDTEDGGDAARGLRGREREHRRPRRLHHDEVDGDNEEVDEDQEDEALVNTLRRFRRSYAEAAAVGARNREGGGNEDDLDLDIIAGGVDDMQRIVSNLARREDIPDEWWAEAGLSRSLPREAA